MKRYTEAEPILEESLAHLKEAGTGVHDNERDTEKIRATLWQAAMECKHFEKAAALAEETVGLCNQHHNVNLEAEWLRHQAIALWCAGQHDLSDRILEQACVASDHSGNYAEQYSARVCLATHAQDSGDTTGAIRMFENAIKIADSHPAVNYPSPPSLEELRKKLMDLHAAAGK